MEKSELTEVSYEKDLGVWISADMKCSKQCMYAFNKATRVLGKIKRTIRFKDNRVMLSLYKKIVRPHVEYCSSAWNPHYIKDKQLIEKVQSRFTKMTDNMEGKIYEERLHWLKLWLLKEFTSIAGRQPRLPRPPHLHRLACPGPTTPPVPLKWSMKTTRVFV